jgi:hypothetical protein
MMTCIVAHAEPDLGLTRRMSSLHAMHSAWHALHFIYFSVAKAEPVEDHVVYDTISRH